MITIRVPATSANLGSGFDALGIAVELFNEVQMEEHDTLDIVSLDEIKVPVDESNLIYSSVKTLYEYCGKPFSGLKIRQTNNIPFARGLGSSSACIVAGLLGGNRLLGEPLSREDLLNLAAELEGHPDNVAPALLGGLVSAVIEDGKVWYVKENIKDDLQFLLIIPNVEMKTTVARAALPGQVSFQDACYNLSRSALMVGSIIQGKYENLKYAAQDRLHQSFRFRHIPYGQEVVDECYQLGAYAATISGAGSTLLAMVGKDSRGIEEELQQYLYRKDLLNWKISIHKANNQGAIIL